MGKVEVEERSDIYKK